MQEAYPLYIVMKKIILLFAIVVGVTLSSAAGSRISRNVDDLPKAAQSTLKKFFNNVAVNRIKIENGNFGNKDYEVVLSNGTEIEFDRHGNVKEVDCGRAAVPAEMILKTVRDYVKENFKGRKIIKVEIDKHKYEVELSDGTELEFDRTGSFLKLSH